MDGSPATCDRCGHELADVHQVCPNCGPASRTVHMEATAYARAVASVRMTTRKLERELKKNWPLILLLICIDLFSMIPAYFLSGWLSVVASLFFVLLSTAIGYYAITRVITITIDHGR
jgi:hypothetical protein